MEIWRYIKGYEGIYKVSDLGRIKSLVRKGRLSEKILSTLKGSGGYLQVNLCKNGGSKRTRVHKIVTMSFLNHKPNGYKGLVVDHINNVKTDNRLANLQLIPHRNNIYKESKFKGSRPSGNKWTSIINVEGKAFRLGNFNTPKEANIAYQEAVILVNNGESVQGIVDKNKPSFSSNYKGVSWHRRFNKWQVFKTVKGKSKFLGYFKTEYDAHLAYQKAPHDFKSENPIK